MWTTEMDHDEILITILDENGVHGDLQVYLYDDLVYIRQYDESEDVYKTIQISPEMFKEFFQAMLKPEGSFVTRK